MQANKLPEKDIHVFCVDDDADFINSMSLVLPDKLNRLYEGDDYLRFSFFVNPVDALEALHELSRDKEEVAMIISDQKMPGMKGTEFLLKTKAIVPDASRVLLTGYAGIDSAVEAINSKLLDRYLTKPIEDENDFVLNLYQMLKTYQMGRTISNQSKALKDLYTFSNRLNSIADYKEALDYIVLFTMKTLQCKRVSIMLLKQDEDNKPYLEIEASQGIPKDVIKSTRLAIGERVAGSVFQNREAVYAKDITELGYVVESSEREHAMFISVPLLWANLQSSEQPVGVINATDKNDGQVFTELDLETLTYISNTASIAINNLTTSKKLKEAYIETKTQAARLTHLMAHDPITGLPNYTMFSNMLRKTIGMGHTECESMSVIIINLLRFREINCSIGHHSGDVLLKDIGGRLESGIKAPQQLFHFGGDEFAILLPDSDAFVTKSVIRDIEQKLADPIEIEGVKIDTDMTFGVATYPEHATDFKLLMQKADVALSQAKQAGKKVSIYDVDNDQYNTRRISMVNELRHAIDNDELVLYYQPKISLSTRQLEGAEALVRWIHPVHGFTPPDQFIPLAEQTGLMESLTEWVAKQAAHQSAMWKEMYLYETDLYIAVNLSTLNLAEPNFPQRLLGVCHQAGVGPHKINLEITESVLMGNLNVALHSLNQLSDMGFQIHLDDFGTGYSSLAYVKRLPIDAIKIDRSFIMNINEDRQDVQIVQSIVELGHSLNLKVIAEGVEGQDAEKLLCELGCDTVQGYYYSRPLPANEFEEWVKNFQKDKLLGV